MEKKEKEHYLPSIDELLKLPEKKDDKEKIADKILDDLDEEIALQNQKHLEEMSKLDERFAQQQKMIEDRKKRYAENAILREKLVNDLTRPELKKLFDQNREFLEEIKSGRIYSSRHVAFHKNLRTRQALMFTLITHPFSDSQIDWTYEEMTKIWLRSKKEHAANNEYVWKVLMPECFIKIYMDFFGLSKAEAEQKIKETPLVETDTSSNSNSD